MYVDSHQHFWKLELYNRPCMLSDYNALNKDFMPTDLMALMNERNTEQIVIVQAVETEFTLNVAKEVNFFDGVVGCLGFNKAVVKDNVDILFEKSLIKDFQSKTNIISYDNWMNNEECMPGILYFIEKGLS